MDALYRGMHRCYDKNPDPGFSIYKLLSRIEDLVIFSHDVNETALICEVRRDDFGNEYLFLWGAYANNLKYDTVKAYNTLKWAASSLEVKYIETVSQRAGWLKLLSQLDDVDVVPTITYRINI